MSGKTKQFVPADADWLYLESYYEDEKRRYVLNRLIGWTLVQYKGIARMIPVADNGFPVADEINDDAICVRGRDRSFWGKPWQEIFDSIIPDSANCREIPAEMAEEIEVKKRALRQIANDS